ncbi:MAG: Rrf2 family transcriptional regulator [Planctomycetes bacterium]|jgi:Rrf2 family protein|nr:Rrf2 family transcriptional regulator [Planctomycetota bacterium]
MISLTAEHALRAVVYLASHPGNCCTVDCIAKHTGIPAGSLAKVLQQLNRAGLVSSQRGPNGGFVLTRAPTALTFMDVIVAADGQVSGRQSVPRDALGRHLQDTRAQVEATYRATTIAQFLREKESANETLVTKGE